MALNEPDSSTVEELEAASLEAQFTFSLNNSKSRIGYAYYDALDGVLYVMEDLKDLSDNYEFVCMIIQQVMPEVILMSSSANENLLTCVEKLALDFNPKESNTAKNMQPTIIIKPTQDYNAANGLATLMQLGIMANVDGTVEKNHPGRPISPGTETSGPATTSGPGNSNLTASAFVNPEASQLSLGAVAVLLAHLQKGSSGEAAGDTQSPLINGVKMIRSDKFMHLGVDTLTSLQIFDQETHANLHFSTTKEGLSLYGTLNNCVTYSGKLLLKAWLIRPSVDCEVIRDRQEEIEYFLQVENVPYIEKVRQQLKNFSNIGRIIMVISSGKSRVGEWTRLLKSVKAFQAIHRLLGEVESVQKTDLFLKILNYHLGDLDQLGRKINEIIDWDESKLNGGRIKIRLGIDEELDEYQEKYAGLESQLGHLAQKLSTEVAFDMVPEFALNYFPQIGYLCTLPRPAQWDGQDSFTEGGWQFQFATDTEIHYKNDHMRQLDHYLGDLTTAISDREVEIVHLLEEELSHVAPTLLHIGESLAHLDCILSLANVTFQRGWVRPTMVQGNIIQIVGGRHPLVEACVETCISNHCHLSAQSMSSGMQEKKVAGSRKETCQPQVNNRGKRAILVVTGANFSGKSVYLKQIALIVILAHMGCFVPAEQAEIGIHDAIFTRMTTTESVSRSSSAFMLDLQQISFMLRNCTSRSILLIDEFGKGTDSVDGQALFCSLIEHLIRRGTECPITVLTTHFHEVFTNGHLPSDLPIEYGHMRVVLPISVDSDVDNVPTYLYKLEPGLVSSSHALGCATVSGVPKHVRMRAAQVSQLLSRFEILELLDVCMDDNEEEEWVRMEKVVRKFVEARFNQEDLEEMPDWINYLSTEILQNEE